MSPSHRPARRRPPQRPQRDRRGLEPDDPRGRHPDQVFRPEAWKGRSRLGQGESAAETQGVPKPHPVAPSPATTRPAPATRTLAPVDGGQANSSAGHHQSPAQAATVEDTPSAPWILEGLTGAGTVLAGSMLLLLRRRRRAQFRARRPGRTIAVPQPVLAPVEKTLTASGSRSAPTVELMDALLWRLAARQSAVSQNMPHVAAVELISGGIVLHLSQAQDLPTPWQGSQDRMRWSCPPASTSTTSEPHESDQPAPYPLLVTIGASDDNDVWLLNCEDLPVITITGDPTYGRDFARYLAPNWPATLVKPGEGGLRRHRSRDRADEPPACPLPRRRR